jgi:hypothetical protein
MKITEKEFNVLTNEETVTEREETALEKQARIKDKQDAAEQLLKQETRENSIKKLAEVTGLTKEELASIL